MKNLSMKNFLPLLSMFLGASAHAVNDLPGGPAVNQLNFHPPVTQLGIDQHLLHNGMMIACIVIFVAVFGVMFYSILKHRKSVGHKAANFHESVTVEIIWTIVPFLIVIAMGLAATKTLVESKDTTNADLTIKATGYQWKWGYDYIKGEGEGLGFISTLDSSHRALSESGIPKGTVIPDDYLFKVDNPMVVPAGKKIRIITTAADVIHAFAVPSFGIKQDAIPGFVRDLWFKTDKIGDYYGQCQELCGKEHAYMPIHIKVVSAADYTAWVAAQQELAAAKQDDPNKVWKLDEIIKRGESSYAKNCAVCHLATGQGTAAYKRLDGAEMVLDKDAKLQIMQVLNGKGQMPAFKGQMSDTDIAAAITYTKNNWSNKTGQLVQPSEVLAARQ